MVTSPKNIGNSRWRQFLLLKKHFKKKLLTTINKTNKTLKKSFWLFHPLPRCAVRAAEPCLTTCVYSTVWSHCRNAACQDHSQRWCPIIGKITKIVGKHQMEKSLGTWLYYIGTSYKLYELDIDFHMLLNICQTKSILSMVATVRAAKQPQWQHSVNCCGAAKCELYLSSPLPPRQGPSWPWWSMESFQTILKH